MMVVAGHEKDNLREMTLTIDEATALYKELERAIEESQDHQTIYNVDIMCMNNASFSFKVNPHIK